LFFASLFFVKKTLKNNCLQPCLQIYFYEKALQSHNSLRDDYAVSCCELDTLVEIASRIEGLVGARMTGGGFGGCTVNLLRRDALDTFQATMCDEYKSVIGYEPVFYVIEASDGAKEI
jgi:galactokinase